MITGHSAPGLLQPADRTQSSLRVAGNHARAKWFLDNGEWRSGRRVCRGGRGAERAGALLTSPRESTASPSTKSVPQ